MSTQVCSLNHKHLFFRWFVLLLQLCLFSLWLSNLSCVSRFSTIPDIPPLIPYMFLWIPFDVSLRFSTLLREFHREPPKKEEMKRWRDEERKRGREEERKNEGRKVRKIKWRRKGRKGKWKHEDTNKLGNQERKKGKRERKTKVREDKIRNATRERKMKIDE